MPQLDCPRIFTLQRHHDETGISGEGRVADGVVWTDGTVSMRWRTATASVSFYDSIADVITIHGHGGKTTVCYLDMQFSPELARQLSNHKAVIELSAQIDEFLNEGGA